MSRILGTALLLALVGCATDDDGDGGAGGGGKADGKSCTDPTYGDGTCQLDLECGIPDIDCFHTFATDAEAGAWLDTVWPQTRVAEDDPRFARARALLDRAWATYQAEASIGKLAEAHLALVLIEDATANAWVISDPERGQAALSVHVHTGIFLEGFTDEDLLGVLFHEIAHIAKLHVFPDIVDRTRRFYLARGSEPVGAFQPDDMRLHDPTSRWFEIERFAGAHSSRSLDDLPVAGNLGPLFGMYLDHAANAYPACGDAINAVDAVYTKLTISPLDDSITADAATTAEIDRTLKALGACTAPHAFTMQAFLATMSSEWQSYMATTIAADEQWLLAEDAFEVLTLLASDRRGKLAAIETKVQQDLGQPWTAVRYFSTEEQADDIAVTMTSAAKLPDPGVSGFMLDALGDARAQCEEAITAGRVPYGVRLGDSHHGTCWRVAHARQLVAPVGTSARRLAAPDDQYRTPFVPTRKPDGKPLY